MTEWRDPAIYQRCAAAMESADVADALEAYAKARDTLRHTEALHHSASREVKSAREATQNAKEDLLDAILAEERAQSQALIRAVREWQEARKAVLAIGNVWAAIVGGTPELDAKLTRLKDAEAALAAWRKA